MTPGQGLAETLEQVGLPGYELPVGGPGGDERDFLGAARTTEGTRPAQTNQ
jgi:hypothetical protein